MNNISKLFKCLLLSAVILCSVTTETKAFGFLPPMPWDLEFNIPNNANKVLSNVQSIYRKVQSIKTNGLSGGLAGLKLGNFDLKGALKGKFASLLNSNKSEKKGGNKTPGRGGVLRDSDLGLPDANSPEALNEEVYYNAYFKLFFQLPSKNSYSGNYSVLAKAYAQKKLDYQQDMIVDTYIAGRMNEDLLNVIEKTINRLDQCRIGELRDNDCVFFGMQLGYTDPTMEETPTTEGDQAGMVGENTNAYIIATVYDRLLRVIEDLTAIEALYNASKQLDAVEPMTTSFNNINKENKFQFAYNSTKEYANAKLNVKEYLKGNVLNLKINKSDACKNGGKGCPRVNKTTIDLTTMDDTEINSKLQPIEDLLTEVMVVHNLKSELPDYKTQYRKYLKAEEIKKRAAKVLEESDSCVVDFIQRHIPSKRRQDAVNLWYGGSKVTSNQHELRGGVSRQLIEEYQQHTTDTIIGTDSKACDGYYEENACPEGYVADKNNPCETDAKLYPCVVELASSDMSAGSYSSKVTNYGEILKEDDEKGDDEDEDGAGTPAANNDNNEDAAEGLIDGTKAEDIDTENRKKAEASWRIGAKAVSDLGRSGQLTFAQWNDQQEIQKEYMTNKYRNMRMIIRSTDKALASYKIARSESSKDPLKIEQEPVANLVKKISAVKTVDEAIKDGSAIRYAAKQGMCAGYEYAYVNGEDKYIDQVTATWTETATSTKWEDKDGDGKKELVSYEYTVNKSKEINLECYAKKKNAGTIDIIKQTYTEGKNPEKSGAITTAKSGSVDLSIKNDEKSYPEELKKEESADATSIIEKIGENSTGCPPTWNYTINGIVKNFMKATLGGCMPTIEGEVLKLKTTAENSKRKREVASDRLDDVMSVKDTQEKIIAEYIKAYNTNVTNLKTRRKRLIQNRTSWSKDLSKAREEKKEYVTRLENSKQRLTMINNDIKSIDQKKRLLIDKLNNNPTLKIKEEIDVLNDSIVMLALESDCISNSYAKECKTCVELANNKQRCKVYNEKDSFITIKEAEKQIKNLDKKIDEKQILIDDSKQQIIKIDEELEKKAADFAEKYIDMAEDAQEKIEKENSDFEDFVAEEDGPRMKAKDGKYRGDDDLMVTIAAFYQNLNNKSINDTKAKQEAIKYAKNQIEEKWLKNIGSEISKGLGALNLPNEIVVSELLDLGMNVTLEAGTYSSFEKVINAIKEAIKNEAAKQIVEYIAQSDRIIHQELEKAIEEVNEWSGAKLCLEGEGDNEVSPACPNKGSVYDIMSHENYLTRDAVNEYKSTNEEPEKGKITIGHLKLIEDLATPENESVLNSAGINLRELFGIPSDKVITTDSEYFVGLPARGVSENIADEDRCTYGGDSKKNAGCDYMAPREPLASIPPLREVFYFSALDYKEIPTTGRKKDPAPALSSLLDFKYQDEDYEYFPEVWNYILARPNMRRDGKYQQTFVERGYGQNKIRDYLKRFKNDEATKVLSRGGVYPCLLSGKVIDLDSHDKIKKVKITRRTGNIPSGAARVQCHDVGYYSSKYIQHLLSDFDGSKKDSKNFALEKVEGGSFEEMYTKNSELSQLLRVDGKKLKYRKLLSSSFEYLENKKNQRNNVDRQLAETVSFKRNVMGSFLENVNAEFNARKNYDKSKQEILDTLKNLCEQLGEYSNMVVKGIEVDEEGNVDTEACAKSIMEDGGLASSSSDTNYNITTEKCANVNSSKGYYTSIACVLDAVKTQKLEEARKLYNEIKSNTRYNKHISKVDERLEEIKNYIEAFDKDTRELSVISPGATATSVEEAVKEAEANRNASLETDNAAIVAMDNQSRSVAYCPVY